MKVGEVTTLKKLIGNHAEVRIPMLQRDYAQGRKGEVEVRVGFIKALKNAIFAEDGTPGEPINLDFVYGTFEDRETGADGKIFAPLDGQQRLTTLFLLHWYLSALDDSHSDFTELFTKTKMTEKSGGSEFTEGQSVHSKFTYHVRQSSREFFDRLVQFSPDLRNIEPQTKSEGQGSLQKLILDQSWYFRSWELDPTVQSVLVVLDAIHQHFAVSSGGYSRLADDENPAITFNFLDPAALKLTDDLYIKMNARGKPLTPFETFKARYEDALRVETKENGPIIDKEFFIGKKSVSVPKFVANRFDRQWADYFWALSGGALFDDLIMNLVRALALVALDTDREENEYEASYSLLRKKDQAPNYLDYQEGKWLNNDFTRLLITLLEAKSHPNAPFKLSSTQFFDDNDLIRRVTTDPADNTKVNSGDYVLFSAYLRFLDRYGSGADAEIFQEWLRVIRNLARNSSIEVSSEFRLASGGVQQLLPRADSILEYLASTTVTRLRIGFAGVQVEEERLKARLLLSPDAGWRELITQAEEHDYFCGQIGFLLDFAGVKSFAAEKDVSEWTKEEHISLKESFANYLQKAETMFGRKGLKPVGDYLWERALLAIGDYLLPGRGNLSFLVDPTNEDWSWKRFLSGTGKASSKRHFLKELWDEMDLESDDLVEVQLQQVIESAQDLESWRESIVSTPVVIKYCRKRFIRYENPNKVYLLPSVYKSGTHAELRSFCLFENIVKPLAATSKWGSCFEVKYDDYTDFPGGPHIELKSLTVSELIGRIYWRPSEPQPSDYMLHLELPDQDDITEIIDRLEKEASYKLSENQECSIMWKSSTPDNIESSLLELAKILESLAVTTEA